MGLSKLSADRSAYFCWLSPFADRGEDPVFEFSQVDTGIWSWLPSPITPMFGDNPLLGGAAIHIVVRKHLHL